MKLPKSDTPPILLFYPALCFICATLFSSNLFTVLVYIQFSLFFSVSFSLTPFERWSKVQSHFGVFPDAYFQPTGNVPEILILLPLRARESDKATYTSTVSHALQPQTGLYWELIVYIPMHIVTAHSLSLLSNFSFEPPTDGTSYPAPKCLLYHLKEKDCSPQLKFNHSAIWRIQGLIHPLQIACGPCPLSTFDKP